MSVVLSLAYRSRLQFFFPSATLTALSAHFSRQKLPHRNHFCLTLGRLCAQYLTDGWASWPMLTEWFEMRSDALRRVLGELTEAGVLEAHRDESGTDWWHMVDFLERGKNVSRERHAAWRQAKGYAPASAIGLAEVCKRKRDIMATSGREVEKHPLAVSSVLKKPETRVLGLRPPSSAEEICKERAKPPILPAELLEQADQLADVSLPEAATDQGPALPAGPREQSQVLETIAPRKIPSPPEPLWAPDGVPPNEHEVEQTVRLCEPQASYERVNQVRSEWARAKVTSPELYGVREALAGLPKSGMRRPLSVLFSFIRCRREQAAGKLGKAPLMPDIRRVGTAPPEEMGRYTIIKQL